MAASWMSHREYKLCNAGYHVGDWERITVEVCGNLQSVLRVNYAAHGSMEERQCWQELPPAEYQDSSLNTLYWEEYARNWTQSGKTPVGKVDQVHHNKSFVRLTIMKTIQ